MIVSSENSRARLFTAFGTVVFVDVGTGELRHGPFQSSPENAFFVADKSAVGTYRQGLLVHETGASCEPIVCRAESSHSVSRRTGDTLSTSPTPLELVPLERGLIAFRAAGRFLSALPDGRITLSAATCSTWELFLASADWCAHALQPEEVPLLDSAGGSFDQRRIKSYIVHPTTRVRANNKPKKAKVLLYGYTMWSHGRVNYDLCKHLHRRGYIVDILNWRVGHANYFGEIASYYDLFMTACDGVQTLVDVYGVRPDRVIAVSHSEFDIRMLIEAKGTEFFEKLANYGVVSEFLYCASLIQGVRRLPRVVPLGINYMEFYAEGSKRLSTVGYASSMSLETYGVELKRGDLAEAATREAGLGFKVAGSTRNQIWFLDMPDFYRTVDAVVTSSISEGAGLMVMEAAAAGRLVIGTPVGHFPLKAYEGAGIIAPVEVEKFKAFTTATLRFYNENPAAYREKCRSYKMPHGNLTGSIRSGNGLS